ncbi:MAG: MFS transporter [Rhodospirillaceae bacterium]|nr:MFS transporter [Rhodospirillaceae bacterium]
MLFERRVLIAMCVLIFANQLGFGAMVPSLPLYAETFGVSATAIGMAIAVYGLARFVTALPSGLISDKWGRRPALAIGGLLSALGNFWSVYAEAYPEFLIARFVAGAGAGMVVTTGSVVLADITTKERRGRMIAIYQGSFIFAVGVGPLPGGVLAQTYGLLAPFWFCAVASLVAGSVALFAVGETRHLAQAKHASGKTLPPLYEQIRLLWTNIGFMLVSGIGLINALTRTGGLFNIVPIIGSFKVGLDYYEIGVGLGVGSILGLLAVYPAGMAVDRWGRKAVIVPATLVTGASFVVFAVADTFFWFATANALWGIASSIGGSAPAAYAADSAPPGMNASAMSLFRMLGDIGYVVGPILLGLIVDMQGADAALFLSTFLLITIGAAFARFAPETYRRQ